jgi:hypothetical protein
VPILSETNGSIIGVLEIVNIKVFEENSTTRALITHDTRYLTTIMGKFAGIVI